jgi:general stress protein 26
MNELILQFLQNERIGVISVLLKNEIIHSATVHFSHQNNRFFIGTSNDTLKAQPFLKDERGNGSLVIGFSEKEMITLQMHGIIHLVSDRGELEKIYKVHYHEHPKAEQYKNDPTTVFLEFIPTWSRYTDFNTDPETIIEENF